jgi:hypothetical protein
MACGQLAKSASDLLTIWRSLRRTLLSEDSPLVQEEFVGLDSGGLGTTPEFTCVEHGRVRQAERQAQPVRLRRRLRRDLAIALAKAETRLERFRALASVNAFQKPRITNGVLSRATDGVRVSS